MVKERIVQNVVCGRPVSVVWQSQGQYFQHNDTVKLYSFVNWNSYLYFFTLLSETLPLILLKQSEKLLLCLWLISRLSCCAISLSKAPCLSPFQSCWMLYIGFIEDASIKLNCNSSLTQYTLILTVIESCSVAFFWARSLPAAGSFNLFSRARHH